jgi:hypothetical protein
MAEQSLTTRLDAAKAELELTSKQIAQAEELRKQALLGDDDKRATELAARLDKLQQAARTFQDKAAVLASEIAREAEEKKAHAMAATKAQVEAKLDARDEAVKELAASIQVFDDCYRKAIRLCKEAGTAWPWQPHDREAALLTPSSVVAATKHQLFKVGTQPRLLGGMDSPDRGPDLPGGQSPRLEHINNPAAVKSMLEVFAAATKCAREILRTGKSTSGEILQTNVTEAGVPVFARKDKPPLTAAQHELSQLLARMNLLSQQTSPEAEKEYFQTVKRVGELQDLIAAEQGTTAS